MVQVARFAEEAYEISSMDDLFGAFQKNAAELDFDYVAVGPIQIGFGPFSNKFVKSDKIAFPESWVKHYFTEDLAKNDPVIGNAFKLAAAQTWQELTQVFDCNPEQREFMGQAGEFGLSSGVTVPLRGAFGALSICSFASSSKKRPTFQTICSLSSLAQIMIIAEDRILQEETNNKDVERLTTRQVECLYWTAMGKSSWDISTILSISENTVNYHIKQAMQRLDTTSRVTAAIRCSTLGLFNHVH